MGITIREIAKKSGFGYGTVVRALSDNPVLVKKETREKILKIAEQYDYVKNVTAQSLSRGKSRDIGVVMPGIFYSIFYNDFYIKLLSGVMEAVTSNGYRLRVIFLGEKESFLNLSRDIRSLNLSGLILASYCGDFFIKKENIQKFKVPVVVLNKQIPGKNIYSVLLDDYTGGYEATNYLAGLGHKRIGIIRCPRTDSEKRYEGYLKAMADNGLEVDAEYMGSGMGNSKAGYEEMAKILAKGKRPTAVFCINDETGLGAIRAIKEKGLRCPDDISVVGYDGIEITDFTDPRLTTMVRPVSEMGKMAVEFLIGKKHRGKKSITLNAVFSKRDSCKRASM